MDTNKFFQICTGFVLIAFVLSCFISNETSMSALGTCLLGTVIAWAAWAAGKTFPK